MQLLTNKGKKTNKTFLLVFIVSILIFSLVGCKTIGPSEAQKFLEAINNGETETAQKYICKEKQDTLIKDLGKASIIGIGKDVMGLKSPGIKDISCQEKDGVISCTYTAPALICSGLSFSKPSQPVKCTAFDPKGAEKTITFEITEGKFCGFK
jgi:hypothetical protein